MIPIGDYAGERRHFPYVNYALIVVNVLAFLYEVMQPDAQLNRFIAQWGAVPREIVTGTDLLPTIGVPVYVTLLTSIFLHGGWLHLGGNMLYLWVFGDNVENAFGPVKYLLFYLVCGVAATAAQIAIDPSSTIPTVGASGAIAGVMGAYLVMFPGATVRTVIILVVFVTVVYLPAILVIGVWFLLQLVNGVTSLGAPAQQGGGVAFFAHIGGLIAGALLALLLRRRDYGRASPTMIKGYERW
jgi:membrane associated rhomboid family serine protease